MSPRWLVGLVAVVAVNAALIVTFHDQSWIPSDDGHYVHVADRLSQGEVLNADVEELHPGYVHFIHAAALEVFGPKVVSLRYPLMVLMAAQSVLAFVLFRRRTDSVALASVAAITLSAIGTLQIANPTTSLYALAATVALVGALLHTRPGTRRRMYSAGVLLGLVFLFRQLTAVFVAMGLLAFLFTEEQGRVDDVQRPAPRDRWVAQGVLGASLVGLAGYLFLSASAGTTVLFGLLPLMLLAWAIGAVTVPNGDAVRMLAQLTVGAVASAVPLLAYHLVNGSLADWLRDTFVRSLSITDLEHIGVGRYVGDLLIPSIRNVVTGSLLERLNGLYWIVLIVAAFALGIRLFRSVRGAGAIRSEHAVPIMVVFYAMVSVFNQIPYYLYLSAGFSLMGWLWMSTSPGRARGAATVAAAVLALAGVAFHAGQPYSRTYDQLVSGDRVPVVDSALPRMGLAISADDEAIYGDLLSVIERESTRDDILFTMPNAAELYFLSDRDNAFRLFNPTISLLDDGEVADFLDEFDAARPGVLVHDTASAYNTDRIDALLPMLIADYEMVESVAHYNVYVRVVAS